MKFDYFCKQNPNGVQCDVSDTFKFYETRQFSDYGGDVEKGCLYGKEEHSRWWIIVLVIVLVIFVAAAGYFLWKCMKRKQMKHYQQL